MCVIKSNKINKLYNKISLENREIQRNCYFWIAVTFFIHFHLFITKVK